MKLKLREMNISIYTRCPECRDEKYIKLSSQLYESCPRCGRSGRSLGLVVEYSLFKYIKL